MSKALFQSKSGQQIPALPPDKMKVMWQELKALGVNQTQVVEAASYSMAMVVRFALGLSAAGGNVCVVAEDSLHGAVALATLRHLINAGANGAVISLTAPAAASPEFALQLLPLSKMGTLFQVSQSAADHGTNESIIAKAHNVLFGVDPNSKNSLLSPVIELLNDANAPIHAVDAPFGVDLESGRKSTDALFASSTLSLGAPLLGLFEGRDCVGRHYVTDVSFTKEIYGPENECIGRLFSEQPVVQIFPIAAE